ncbi:hypothetical protein QVD17_37395 [Tagetes erecta]|uniref:tRNA (guanine-N(7)-)-methyltransferase n=1 Tax=Tagetes erecta TaxID=13708 RepID=A0AAD8NIA8_TARER|nr:hypothetical protein QVD17_37395 [Tagetes erecta]
MKSYSRSSFCTQQLMSGRSYDHTAHFAIKYMFLAAHINISKLHNKNAITLLAETTSEVTSVLSMQLEEKVALGDESNPCISKSTRLPRKRFYRARAHSNPLSDSHFPVPISPQHVEYSLHYPHFFPTPDSCSSTKKIEFADVGCGFGGLLISLATLFPDTLMIGMELRDKVTEYVKERILALRVSNPGQYQNVSVVRTNSMKYIPNYFEKSQLSKMFFLFPDPHFKEKNHRRRVISPFLLDEYAYVIKPGGIIYTITDVEELGEWMKTCLENHPMFESLTEEQLEADPVVKLLSCATEEGQKVSRNEGQTFKAVYRRIVLKD